MSQLFSQSLFKNSLYKAVKYNGYNSYGYKVNKIVHLFWKLFNIASSPLVIYHLFDVYCSYLLEHSFVLFYDSENKVR